MNYTQLFAQRVRNATAQRVLARDPRNHKYLASNPNLTNEAFALVAQPETPYSTVQRLLSNRHLTDWQFAHILTTEAHNAADVDKLADRTVGGMLYYGVGANYLDAHFGDSEELWLFALRLLEHFDPHGTLKDFVITVNAGAM